MRAIVLTDILAAVDDVLEQLQPVLQPGERVVWSGRPDPGVIFTAADAYLEPFYVIWTSSAVFAFFNFQGSPGAGFAAVIPLLFMVIGIYLVFGRFAVKAAGKRRTAYAVTDRRVLVVRGSNVAESPLGVQKTTRRARNGKHMSITFGAVTRMSIFGQNRSIPNAGLDFMSFASPMPVAFYDVADVDGLSSALASVSVAPPSTQSSPS